MVYLKKVRTHFLADLGGCGLCGHTDLLISSMPSEGLVSMQEGCGTDLCGQQRRSRGSGVVPAVSGLSLRGSEVTGKTTGMERDLAMGNSADWLGLGKT